MSDSIEERVRHARELAKVINAASRAAIGDENCDYEPDDILQAVANLAIEIDTALFPIADAPAPILNWAPEDPESADYKLLASRVRRNARQEVGAR